MQNTFLRLLVHSKLSFAPLLTVKHGVLIHSCMFERQIAPVSHNVYRLTATKSIFSSFLSTPIVFVREGSRKVFQSGDNLVDGCIFENIHINGTGAAIYDTSEGTLTLKNTMLNNCTTKTIAGAVFKANGETFHTRNCYNRCYIDAVVSDEIGNACHLENCSGIYNYTFHKNCGMDINFHGDTPLGFVRSSTFSSHNNFTLCYGLSGFLEISYRYPKPDSYGRFHYVCHCGSHGILESQYGFVSYLDSNYVNNTEIRYLFYFKNCTPSITSCVFYNNRDDVPMVYNGTLLPIIVNSFIYPAREGFIENSDPVFMTLFVNNFPQCLEESTFAFTAGAYITHPIMWKFSLAAILLS